MREVIHGPRGTAKAATLDMPGVEMAGKTGTSQVRRLTAAERAIGYKARAKLEIPWIHRDHALFVCFAPYADPRYAISVIVEHGKGGSTAAGPIARDIMRRVLELNPSGAELPTAQLPSEGRST
jgi:penicillin-binding protein 2